MPREIPLCEREITEIYFQGLRQFLEGLTLTPNEALIIFEVYKSRRSHVGVDLISRKVHSLLPLSLWKYFYSLSDME